MIILKWVCNTHLGNFFQDGFGICYQSNRLAFGVRLTQRALDAWWAPPKKQAQARAFLRFVGWVSQPRVTQTVSSFKRNQLKENRLSREIGNFEIISRIYQMQCNRSVSIL